jgi:hypothetical protein
MKQRAGRSDDTPLLSTPRVVYDGDHVARKNRDIDLLGAQLEAIRSNGECANKLLENLFDIVQILSDEIRILKKGNENFKHQTGSHRCRRVSLSCAP